MLSNIWWIYNECKKTLWPDKIFVFIYLNCLAYHRKYSAFLEALEVIFNEQSTIIVIINIITSEY